MNRADTVFIVAIILIMGIPTVVILENISVTLKDMLKHFKEEK